MTPVQVRMARAALDLTVAQLAERAAVEGEAIELLEDGASQPEVGAKLRATLERAGIEFLGEDGVRYQGGITAPGLALPVELLNSANDE